MTQIGKAYSSGTCPFRLSVINDELTPDFGRACEIASKDFGLHWIELRSMWNKNVTELDAKEIAESRAILKKYELRVTDIASPLFKVDWPGAPLSQERPQSNFKPIASAASTSGGSTIRPRIAPPSTKSCAGRRRCAQRAT